MQEAKRKGPTPEESRLQQNSADIRKVERALEAVEKKVEKLDAEIDDLKRTEAPEVWRDEVIALRKEKEQLGRKEEQLREKELMLMRQALEDL